MAEPDGPRCVRMRRRAWAAALGAAGLSLLSLPVIAPRADAAQTFELGSGKVRANLFEVVPRTGGLTIPYSGGKALAAYQGHRAEATATVGKPFLPVEPKVVTDILEGKSARPADCGDKAPGGGGGGGEPGAPPTSSPFTFNLSVNSDQENSEAGKREVFAASPDGSPVGGSFAEQQVFATDTPDGHAIATQGRLGVEAVFEMLGGRSDTRAGVIDGKTRAADGSVTMERLSLLDGAVVMEDLRWSAVQRTGEGPAKESSFSMGRAEIMGTPFAPPDLGPNGAAFFAAVNQVLAPTGLMLDPPRVADDDDEAKVTAMSIRLSDSPLGRAAVGPVVGTAQPVRDPLVDALLGFSCDFGLFVTVADVILSGASGSGGVSFDFGGITAKTDGTVFDNPFGNGFGDIGDLGDGAFGDLPAPVDGIRAGDIPPPVALPVASPLVERPAPAPAAGSGRFPPAAALPPPAPLPSAPAADDTPAGGVEEVASPVFAPQIQPALGSSLSRADGDRGGSALAAGLIGLLAIAALIAADAFHIRRMTGTTGVGA